GRYAHGQCTEFAVPGDEQAGLTGLAIAPTGLSGLACCVDIASAVCVTVSYRPSHSPTPMPDPIASPSMPRAMSGMPISAASWACSPPIAPGATEDRSGQRAHQPPGAGREDDAYPDKQ